MTSQPQVAAVLSVIDEYFQGMYHGDGARLRLICHPDLTLFGSWRGELVRQSLEEWITETRAASPASAGEAFEMSVRSLDFHGPLLATAQVTDVVHGVRYLDVLTFAVIEGRWIIVAKFFQTLDDSAAAVGP